jgi:putative SOS response-associated peptidase YedK
MCGRFSLQTPAVQVAERFHATLTEAWDPSERFTPFMRVPILRMEGNRLVARTARWGLVPAWAKEEGIAKRAFNARAETAGEKPTFREAFRKRRCLIPADGFFEWRHAPTTGKTLGAPWYFTLRDGGILPLAGLWEEWRDGSGALLETCTVLTTQANGLVEPIHDRMPVILRKEEFRDWLGPQPFTGTLAPLDPALMAVKEAERGGMNETLGLDLR